MLFILLRMREETFPSVPSPHLVPSASPNLHLFLLLYILQLTLSNFVHPLFQVLSEFPFPIMYVALAEATQWRCFPLSSLPDVTPTG